MADETIAILFTLVVLPFALYKLLFGVSSRPPREPRQPAPAPPRTKPEPGQATPAHGTALEKVKA